MPWEIGPAGLWYHADHLKAVGFDTDPEAMQRRIQTWNDGFKRLEDLKTTTNCPRDEISWRSPSNSVWLLNVTILNLVIAFALAFTLNSGLGRSMEVFRTAFVSSVAISLVFVTLYGLNYGALRYALGLMGLALIDWLADPTWTKLALALVVIWRHVGWTR